VRRNEQGLSDRQVEVLKLIVAGMTNKEIAGVLALAEGTVKIHVASVFHALGVNNRLDAARMATTMHLLKDPQ
jgi:DNA-binding NarL/FixJ family response regulator